MLTGEQVEIILDVDLDKEPECESPHHMEEPLFHGGPVTHVVRGPCPHVQGLRCAGWVNWARNHGCRCTVCRADVHPEQITFIQI